MALRYFNPTEPEYVPTYTPLDPQIVSLTNQQIEKQGATAQQYRRDTFDLATENIASGLDVLGEQDRMYAQERLSGAKQRINEIVQEQGARNSMPFVDQEVGKLTSELKPLMNVAQQKRQAVEKLDENEDLSSGLKSFVLDKFVGGEYDKETGKLLDAKSELNAHDLEVAANWEDMNEFMNTFNSKARKANITEGGFNPEAGGGTMMSASGEMYDFRRKQEVLNGDELMLNNMDALLSNDKMREQLALLAKAELSQENDEVTVDKDGRIHKTYYVPKTNEKGQYLDDKNNIVEDYRDAAVDKKTETFANAQYWQATELSRPYADRDAYYRTQYETRKSTQGGNTSEDMSEASLFRDTISWKVDSKNASKYFSELNEEISQISRNNEIASESLAENVQELYGTADPVTFSFENGVAKIKKGGETITKEQMLEEFDTQIANEESPRYRNALESKRNKVLNRLAILETDENRINAIEREIKTANDSVVNELRDYPEYRGIVDALTFSDAGEISIDAQKFEDIQRKGGADLTPEELKREFEIVDYTSPTGKMNRESIEEGEVIAATIRRPIGRSGSDQRDVFVTRKNGELVFYDTDTGDLGKLQKEATKLQQKRVDELRGAGETKNTIGIGLNPKNKIHEAIIEKFSHDPVNPETAAGALVHQDGSLVDQDDVDSSIGERFIPTTLSIVEGQPVIGGYIGESEGKIKEGMSNLRLTGEVAESIIENQYGADYHNVLSAESLKSLLPRLVNDGEAVNISSDVLNNMLYTNFKGDFSIRYKNVKDSYGTRDSFMVYKDGKQIAESANPYGIVTSLLRYHEAGSE